jgi:hypothetical protein
MRGLESKIYEARKQIAKQDLNAYRSMTVEEQLSKAGERVVNDAIHAAIKKRQRAELAVIAKANKDVALSTIMATQGVDEMTALRKYTAFTSDGTGGVQTMESVANGVSSYYLGKIPAFFQLMQESSFAGIEISSKNSMDYVKESFGIDSQNPLAKKAWKEVESARKELIDHFNRKGGDVAPLANYRNPQSMYSYSVSRKGGKDGEVFIHDMMQWVDRSEYINADGTPMSDVQMKAFLKEAFVTLKTDGANKPPGEGGGAGSVANRMKAHRQIHYKSPEAYMASMSKYGSGNLDDQIRGSFDSLSGDIALVEKFGPNAIHEFNQSYSEAVSKTGRKDDLLKSAFDSMSGQVGVQNVAVAHWFGEVRSAMVASRLGSMLISQMADAATAQAITRSLNIPTSELLGWLGKMSDGDAREMARLHGLGLESALNNISRFASDASTSGFFGKAASVVPTIQGANLWTKTWRQAFGVMLEAKLGDMASKYPDWASVPEGDRLRFEAFGIKGSDFSIWKLAQPTEFKGSKILGPDAIERIPTADIISAIPDRIKTIMDQGAVLVQRMTDQTGKEMTWVSGRETKFNDYKTKIQGMIDGFIQTREKRLEDMSQRTLSRAGELIARMDKAELDMEFAKKSIEAMNEKRTDRFMVDVQRGVEWYGRRRSEIGERLGAKRHSSKLAAYANDAAVDRIGKDLSEKFNKLFGMERTEDGFKVVGEVTKALKEFDAYSDKMEQRISNATKKDGTPKKGKEGTIERAEKLGEQARIEFNAIKQRAETALEDLRVKSEGKLMELEGLKDLIESKKARAENEADIASYLETEKNRDKVQGLVDTLEFRMNQAGDRSMSEGERLGYRRAMADSRIRQMDKDLKAAERIAGKEVFAKATELEKRIDKRMAELAEFTKSVEQRADQRQTIIDEWQRTIGDKVNKEAEIARQEAAMRLVTFTVEQSHQAVLQPGALSQAVLQGKRGEWGGEIFKTLTQFKSFPMAFMRQMLIERANFEAAGYNPWVFRAKLLGATTVLGGMALVLNDVLSGKDPRKIFDSKDPAVSMKFGYQALMKGGGLGFFGDVVDMFKNTSENPYQAAGLLGPAGGYVVGSLAPTVVSGISAIATQDEKHIKQFSKSAYDSIKGITPGQNLWFIKGFLHNVLLDDFQEMANPGYKSRAKQRAMENNGNQYWMGMGNETRSPEFGNIVERN